MPFPRGPGPSRTPTRPEWGAVPNPLHSAADDSQSCLVIGRNAGLETEVPPARLGIQLVWNTPLTQPNRRRALRLTEQGSKHTHTCVLAHTQPSSPAFFGHHTFLHLPETLRMSLKDTRPPQLWMFKHSHLNFLDGSWKSVGGIPSSVVPSLHLTQWIQLRRPVPTAPVKASLLPWPKASHSSTLQTLSGSAANVPHFSLAISACPRALIVLCLIPQFTQESSLP